MILLDSCLMELSRGHKHCSQMNICINNFRSSILNLERTIDSLQWETELYCFDIVKGHIDHQFPTLLRQNCYSGSSIMNDKKVDKI